MRGLCRLLMVPAHAPPPPPPPLEAATRLFEFPASRPGGLAPNPTAAGCCLAGHTCSRLPRCHPPCVRVGVGVGTRFVHDYMLNKVGMSSLVSGFFWDDFWPAPGGGFPDALRGVAEDTGLDKRPAAWGQITDSYHANMDALCGARLAHEYTAGGGGGTALSCRFFVYLVVLLENV